METSQNVIDDRGTSQPAAAEILQRLRDDAFDGSDQKLAVALGREPREVEGWIKDPSTVDADVLIKARGIAMERGIEIE